MTTPPPTRQTSDSWVPDVVDSGYDLDHLPFAVGAVAEASTAPSAARSEIRVFTRVGGRVLDLAALRSPWRSLFDRPALDEFLAAGPSTWMQVRSWLRELLTDPSTKASVSPRLRDPGEVRWQLPFTVADYVDFYASEHHAGNVGRIFRPDGPHIGQNWRHLPVGYHGRSGTVVVSGTPVARPAGQRSPGAESGSASQAEPVFGPTQRLDLEAEVGFVVGAPSRPGVPVRVAAWEDHVFGVVGLNDWSARDIQSFEYVPLGPFLGKSFATSISAWVTPLAALTAARVALPGQHPPPLEHLAARGPAGYDIGVEVVLGGQVVSRPSYASMYWAPSQLVAHLTSNGAHVRTGDLLGSGTISGPTRAERGSLLELSWNGTEPFEVGGEQRTFLRDGDEVTLRYTAPGVFGPIRLGDVTGRVLAGS